MSRNRLIHVIENKNAIPEGVLITNICETTCETTIFGTLPPDSHPSIRGWALSSPAGGHPTWIFNQSAGGRPRPGGRAVGQVITTELVNREQRTQETEHAIMLHQSVCTDRHWSLVYC